MLSDCQNLKRLTGIRGRRGGSKRTVNGMLWEMSELITQERIAVGPSNLAEGLTT